MPIVSTAIVPTKLCQMMRRVRLAVATVSTKQTRSLPDLIAPEDIANLALFLASDDSRLMTKQTISVNAGVL
jgi:NAD(P)-dependent dehydrogenase (short-subunit alcohol dehydrogenase family)